MEPTEAFCVAGGTGTNRLAYSYDGITWIARTSSLIIVNGVAWNGSQWIAVGHNQGASVTITTSPDGITWADASNNPFEGGQGGGVAWNGSLWVAVGFNGDASVTIATSPDGITWTAASNNPFSGSDPSASGIAWNGSIWVAVGYNGDGRVSIATSPDGITWTARTNPLFAGGGYGIAWNGLLWVVVGNGTTTIATSPDGITWTPRTNPLNSFGFGVAWNGSLWVAVGNNADSSVTIATSSNGIIWTPSSNNPFSGGQGAGITWNGLWVAVGNNSDNTVTIATSPDGITWTPTTKIIDIGQTVASRRVLYPPIETEKFCVAGGGGTNSLAYSYDGLIWNGATNPILEVKGVAWNGNLWVAVGANSEYTISIITSPDGITWTPANNNVFNGQYATALGIAWNGSLWVAIGSNSDFTVTIATSPDGFTWTARSNPFNSPDARGIAWNGSLWVAVGRNIGRSVTIITSPDGITWTAATGNPFSLGTGNGIAWNGYLWVAVGYNEGQTLGSIATSTDGITWTYSSNNPFTGGQGRGIAWNGIWVAVGYGSATIATSPDGMTWTARTNPFNSVQGIAWNGSLWVAVGYNVDPSVTIATSPDGITWTPATSMFIGGNAVASHRTLYPPLPSEKFCVAGGGGTSALAYSYDGLSWNSTTSSLTAVRGVAWNGSLWVAVGNNDDGSVTITTSPDGITWTDASNNPFTSRYGYGIAWNGIWVAVGWNVDNTVTIATSPDGATWTGQSNPLSAAGQAVAWNGSLWVAVGANVSQTVTIVTSPDGITWTPSTNNPFELGVGNGIAWNGIWVAVGTRSAGGHNLAVIATSPDGATWTVQSNPFDSADSNARGIAWNGSLWVVVANNISGVAAIATSPDGITWTNRNSPFDQDGSPSAFGIAWNGYLWIAVGNNGNGSITIVTSPDGITWTLANNMISEGLAVASRRVLYPPIPLTPLVLLKAINYTSGTWNDESGHGRNASIENGTATKNAAGNGLVLDGQTNWIFPNVAVGNAWTANVWYKNNGEPVGDGSSTYANILTQKLNNDGALINLSIGRQASPNYTGGFAAQGQGTPITITNAWMNIQVTWDGTNLATYIDGTLIGTTQSGGTSQDGGVPYRIGRMWDTPIYMVGEIGEVRIYNFPLTQAQVSADYLESYNTFMFNPTRITSNQLWLDAADINSIGLVSGNYVNQMNDKSGNGVNYVQANAAYQPKYEIDPATGLHGLNMNGSGLYPSPSNTAYTFAPTSEWTIMTAHRYKSPSGTLWRGYDNYMFLRFIDGNPQIIIGGGEAFPSGTYQTLSGISCVTDTAGAGYKLFMNGSLLTAQNAWAPMDGTSMGLDIGCYNGSPTNPVYETMDGYIYEFIVFTSALSTIERQVMEGYLAWKWGLHGNLPNDHPYYSSPPQVDALSPLVLLKAINYTSGTWNDESGHGRNASIENGTATKNADGNGLVLDGSTNWTFPNVQVGNAWTANVWYKNTGPQVGEGGGNAAAILTQEFSGGGTSINLAIGDLPAANNGKIQCGFFDTNLYWKNSSDITLTNSWMNIQATWDGTVLKTYINGTLFNTVTPGGVSTDSGLPYRIGRRHDLADYMVGEIGEVRVYNQPLTQAQVTADYNASLSNFAPPTPLVLLKASDYTSGVWQDESPYSNNASIENGTATKNADGNGLVLDGSTNWTFPNVQLGNAWTANVWYKNTGPQVGEVGGIAAAILTQEFIDGGSINLRIGDLLGLNNGKIQCGFFNVTVAPQSTDITLTNAWMNIQATWDGTNLKTYVNGTLFNTVQSSGVSTDSGLPYRIGRRWDYADYMVGEIGEVRIYNKALTQAQVTADYNESAQTFATPVPGDPPTALTLTTNTITGTSFGATWTGGLGATSYTYTLNGTVARPSYDKALTSQKVTFTDLTPATSYTLIVTATNTNGSVTATTTITTLAAPTPATPQLITELKNTFDTATNPSSANSAIQTAVSQNLAPATIVAAVLVNATPLMFTALTKNPAFVGSTVNVPANSALAIYNTFTVPIDTALPLVVNFPAADGSVKPPTAGANSKLAIDLTRDTSVSFSGATGYGIKVLGGVQYFVTPTNDTLVNLGDIISFVPNGGSQVTFKVANLDIVLAPVVTVICFLGDAPVLTPTGYTRIDRLKLGDIVTTPTGTAKVEAIKKESHKPSFYTNPYVIPEGKFGANRKLLISPRHKVLVDGKMVEAQFLGLEQEIQTKDFVYYNIQITKCQNMIVAGVEVESLERITNLKISSELFNKILATQYGGKITDEMKAKIALSGKGFSAPMRR